MAKAYQMAGRKPEAIEYLNRLVKVGENMGHDSRAPIQRPSLAPSSLSGGMRAHQLLVQQAAAEAKSS